MGAGVGCTGPTRGSADVDRPLRAGSGGGVRIRYTCGVATGMVGMEEALQREQLFSKSVLNNLPGIFYLYTYPEKRLVLWNKQHETLLGYNTGEIKDFHVTEWFAPEYREAVNNQ